MNHIIESQQFEPDFIREVFKLADKLDHKKDASMKGRILASLFYEPSTRTRFSFESAMLRLGGSVIATENAKEFSSAAKGETLEDSIRVLSQYADVIVLRHPEAGAAKRASLVSSIPVINAGDGAGQHPTQALLDLYTIQRELKRVEGVTIAMVGDLKNGRTVRSLCYLLRNYKPHIIFVSPEELKMKDDIKEWLKKHEVQFEETTSLESVISRCDVVYQTRIQKERFSDLQEYEKLKGVYQITNHTVDLMKDGAIIMHPLPRVDEILPEVDERKQAVYFKQARYGLLVRMALLKLLLK